MTERRIHFSDYDVRRKKKKTKKKHTDERLRSQSEISH